MKRFTHFLIYNNTVPLIFGVLFLGAGATFAASPEARSTVVNSQTTIQSIDNSYLLNTEISDATVEIVVGSVTENGQTYFVEYQMSTIGIKDGVWQPVTVTKTLEVLKEIVLNRDLGLYSSEELSEVHAYEVTRLKKNQEEARSSGITPKVVATEYSGLVGRFLDSEQEVFPGYDPLIPLPKSVPLTSAERAAYEADQRRIAEENKTIQVVTDNGEEVVIPPIGGENQDGGGETGDTPPSEEELPVVEPPIDPAPTPEPLPTTDPAPEPTPEPPQTLESIGL